MEWAVHIAAKLGEAEQKAEKEEAEAKKQARPSFHADAFAAAFRRRGGVRRAIGFQVAALLGRRMNWASLISIDLFDARKLAVMTVNTGRIKQLFAGVSLADHRVWMHIACNQHKIWSMVVLRQMTPAVPCSRFISLRDLGSSRDLSLLRAVLAFPETRSMGFDDALKAAVGHPEMATAICEAAAQGQCVVSQTGLRAALGLAMRTKQLDTVAALLDVKGWLAIRLNTFLISRTLFAAAVETGEAAIVQMFLDLPPARVNLSAHYNQALQVAVSSKVAWPIVPLLLAQPLERGIRLADSSTVLIRHICSFSDGHAVLRQLLDVPGERGLQLHRRSRAIMQCIIKADAVQSLQLLLDLPAERGFDPAADSNCALVHAAKSGRTTIVRQLLALPRSRFDLAVNGDKALRGAVRNGYTEIVRDLLAQPADRGIDAAADANAAVRLAVEQRQWGAVGCLLALPPARGVAAVVARDEEWTANCLLFAVRAAYLPVVRQLMALIRQHGLCFKDTVKDTVKDLFLESRPCSAHVLAFLARLPAAETGATGPVLTECLTNAMRRTHMSLIYELIALPADRGVDVGRRDGTLLRWLAASGAAVAVQRLAALPASRGAASGTALTAALELAIRGGRMWTATALLALPPSRGLCLDGALLEAVEGGKVAAVRKLLELPRARGLRPGRDANAALRKAVALNRVKTVKLLLDAPVDLGIDPGVRNCLSLAAQRGFVEIVRLLLECPAGRGVRPARRRNLALRAAASAPRAWETVTTLRELGAARGVDLGANGGEVLCRAVKNVAKGAGVHRLISMLLKESPVCRAPASVFRALLVAAPVGDKHVVMTLIKALPVWPRAKLERVAKKLVAHRHLELAHQVMLTLA